MKGFQVIGHGLGHLQVRGSRHSMAPSRIPSQIQYRWLLWCCGHVLTSASSAPFRLCATSFQLTAKRGRCASRVRHAGHVDGDKVPNRSMKVIGEFGGSARGSGEAALVVPWRTRCCVAFTYVMFMGTEYEPVLSHIRGFGAAIVVHSMSGVTPLGGMSDVHTSTSIVSMPAACVALHSNTSHTKHMPATKWPA